MRLPLAPENGLPCRNHPCRMRFKAAHSRLGGLSTLWRILEHPRQTRPCGTLLSRLTLKVHSITSLQKVLRSPLKRPNLSHHTSGTLLRTTAHHSWHLGQLFRGICRALLQFPALLHGTRANLIPTCMEAQHNRIAILRLTGKLFTCASPRAHLQQPRNWTLDAFRIPTSIGIS